MKCDPNEIQRVKYVLKRKHSWFWLIRLCVDGYDSGEKDLLWLKLFVLLLSISVTLALTASLIPPLVRCVGSCVIYAEHSELREWVGGGVMQEKRRGGRGGNGEIVCTSLIDIRNTCANSTHGLIVLSS
jgi:hypothetical protein